MGVVEVVVVVGAVQVGGHGGHEFCAVLPVVAVAHLDTGDLGQGVRTVGRFQWAGEQAVFLHRLGSCLGIDAGGAQEQQALHVVLPGAVDDVALDDEVVVDELRRVGVVGVDAADAGGGQQDVVGLFFSEEAGDGGLVTQLQFSVGTYDQVGVAPRLQAPH